MAQTFKDRLTMLIGSDKPYAWARKVGIEKGLFQYYWQKEKIPTYLNLIKIQKYTGCSLDWLLTGSIVHLGRIRDLPLVREPKAIKDRLNKRRISALENVNSVFEAGIENDVKLLELFLERVTPGKGRGASNGSSKRAN